MIIKEEQYDGFKVVYCPNCKMHFKSYYHDGEEKEVNLCPSCSKKSNEVIKNIHKKVTAAAKYSIMTESIFFNY